MTQRVFLSILTLLVVLCIGLSVIFIGGAVLLVSGTIQRGELNDWGQPLNVEMQPAQDLPLIPTLPSSGDLSPEIARQMDEIQWQVIQIRGLQPIEPIHRDVLSSEQLKQRVIDDFFVDYSPEDAGEDVRVLSAFGLLEPEFDLHDLYLDLYSEQVAGYYDSESKEMYVVQEEGFYGPERMTYAHEFTHVLQDQAYDLRDGLRLNEDYCEEETEYCAAVTALIEGDAVFTEQTWLFRYSTDEDKIQIQEYYLDYQSPVFDTAPDFLKEDFLFPYQAGLEFVQTLYDLGGWSAIDDAFTDPPVSTEQILHPDDYPNDRPQDVKLPDLLPVLGDDWKELDRNVLGEWYTYLVLAFGIDEDNRLPESTARRAAGGWNGDAYAIYWKGSGDETVLLMRWLWETDVDTDEAWEALEEYGRRRWSQPHFQQDDLVFWEIMQTGYVTIVRNGQEIVWLIAPDEVISEDILKSLHDFREQ